MAEHNNDIEKSKCAAKILFAEDLIRFVTRLNVRVRISGRLAVPYRRFIYNGFNKTIELAVRFLNSSMEMDHYHMIQNLVQANAGNRKIYIRLANIYKEEYFAEGFDANNFLHYCVHLAGLADDFYTIGILDAPRLAVRFIVWAILDYDMTTGRWEALNRIAQRYASAARDSVDALSPETTDEEDIEDDDSEPEAELVARDRLFAVSGGDDGRDVRNRSSANEANGARRSSWVDGSGVQSHLERSKSDAEAQLNNLNNRAEKKDETASCGPREQSSSSNASEIRIFKVNGFEKESSADCRLDPGASRVDNESNTGT